MNLNRKFLKLNVCQNRKTKILISVDKKEEPKSFKKKSKNFCRPDRPDPTWVEYFFRPDEQVTRSTLDPENFQKKFDPTRTGEIFKKSDP